MDREFFRNPVTDPDYSISGFWFWNDEITDEKTTEQMNMMKRIHANQPVVHSRFGLQNEYLSRDWFERIKSVIGNCKENGQKIWLYDENNWPSGNCAWTITREEKYREHFLQFDTFELKKGEKAVLKLSEKQYINLSVYEEEWEPLLYKDMGQEGGGYIFCKGCEENLRIEGDVATYLPKRDGELVAVYVAVDSYEPVGKLCVDYLNKEAIRLFIEKTHEQYREQMGEEFGKIISGIFMDETRFCNAMPWTGTLQEEFIRRKGYDLVPYLPLLIRRDGRSSQIRFDYYDVISDMYGEATFGQIYEWCNQHGMKAMGHFLGEETISAQSYFGGDMLRGYQYFHVPAIDHLGNGIGSLDAKFAVSACHSYGKSRIACEAFGASGWDITFEDMVRISNWLFQQGINLIIMHGFYYSIRDERSEDFPPSYFYQWKYWDSMPLYVKMANRMMKVLSDGRHEAEILVYTPIETFWNYFQPDLQVKTGFWREGPWITDERARFIDNQFQLLCNGLTDKNLDYDIFHSDAARNFRVEGRELVNVLSGERFRIFILPFTELLTAEMTELLNQFAENGGCIISLDSQIKDVVAKDGSHFREKIRRELTTENHVKMNKISEVLRYCREQINLPFEILCGVEEMAHSLSSYPARLIDPYIHDGERVYGVGVSRYRKEGKRIFNFTNYNDKDEDLKVWIASASEPEIWVPETGDIYRPSALPGRKGGYEISFTLPKNRTYFIVGSL
jgi:hypothetical protein